MTTNVLLLDVCLVTVTMTPVRVVSCNIICSVTLPNNTLEIQYQWQHWLNYNESLGRLAAKLKLKVK